jgi:Transposase DNA-binding
MQSITLKDFPNPNFGDIRRSERFVKIIDNLRTQPGSTIPKQNNSWYDTKATYEFFKMKMSVLTASNDSSVLMVFRK